jgi:hypothetical protein
MRVHVRRTWIVAAVVLAGCTGADQVGVLPVEREAGAAPAFVTRAAGAPGFESGTVDVMLRLGVADADTLRFEDGTPYAVFAVGAESARGASLRGRTLPADTSVRITLARTDARDFVVVLEPAGLRFNPAAPAQLTILTGHGVGVRGNQFALYKQETVDAPWELVPSTFDRRRGIITAPIGGFTRYAVASGN